MKAKKPATNAPAAVAPYVVGFLFDKAFSFVALIRKDHPDWQRGLLNGIGGKVEPGEDATAAMVREFAEEAGLVTQPADWIHFGKRQGDEPESTGIGGSFRVDFFAAIGPIFDLRTMTKEEVLILKTADVATRPDLINGLAETIALAMAALKAPNEAAELPPTAPGSAEGAEREARPGDAKLSNPEPRSGGGLGAASGSTF